MQTARMGAYIDAPIERVWEILIDYPGYARIPGVQMSRMLEHGREHPMGVGAVRELRVAGTTFAEEILEFEPPRRLAYRIIRSRPLRIDHEMGRVELISRGSGTEVKWSTTFRLAIPLIGDALSRPLRVLMQHNFNEMLLWLKDDLERRSR